MKQLIKAVTMGAVAALAIAGNAFAQTNQIPSDRTITRIHVYGTYVVVRFTPDFPNTLGCLGGAGQVDNSVVIDFGADSNAKNMYAIALSAYMTGKKVGFGILGCSPNFGGGVPLGYRVDVTD